MNVAVLGVVVVVVVVVCSFSKCESLSSLYNRVMMEKKKGQGTLTY